MSAADIRATFPGYETPPQPSTHWHGPRLPQEGAWYTGAWESEEMASKRAERVAAWLRAPALHDEIGDEVLTLVMHGGFIDVLVKALLGLPAVEGGGSEGRAGAARVISDCHFRKTATEYDSKPGTKWLSCTAK